AGGVERMLQLIHEDAEWHTYRGAEVVYRGHEGIRRYYAEVAGTATTASARPYTVRELGEAVLVSGSLETSEPGGAMAQHQVHWVYWLTDGKISRAASFPRREQAEAAARSGVIPSGARG